jgi:hypothetical protein
MKKNLLLDFKKNLNLYSEKKINLNLLRKNITQLKKEFLNKDNFHIVIKNFENNPKKIEKKLILFSKLFGEPLDQNKNLEKFVKIKPNIKLLKKKQKDKSVKLRYHQTNAGGAIHSDGPQLSTPPKYVIMGCIRQAEKGGYSIITSAKKIADFLKLKKPKTLNILKNKFFFERRGFNYANKNIFNKPIFTIKKNFFRFRYLREYIEAAYSIKSIKLDKNQNDALNILDKLLVKKKFQSKYKLNEGDIIILNNNYLAHGRSSFKLNILNQRSLMRIWIK